MRFLFLVGLCSVPCFAKEVACKIDTKHQTVKVEGREARLSHKTMKWLFPKMKFKKRLSEVRLGEKLEE